MLDHSCRVEGVTLYNQILWRLPESPNLFAALHCHDETRFLLDSCETELVWNAFCILSMSWCRHHSWLPPLSATHSQELLLHSSRREWQWPCPLMETFDFFLPGRLRLVPFHGLLPFPLWFKMMDPSFISCKNVGEDGLSLSVKTQQQLKRNGFSLSFMFKYKALKNPSYAHLRISRSWIMWLTHPLLTAKLSASCWVVMCQSSWTMASACCSISWLTAMTERPEQGKLHSSALAVSEAITPFAQWPTVLLSTAAPPQALERCWAAFLTDDLMVTRNCITARCS